jgi:predicted secreted acid phosphatase
MEIVFITNRACRKREGVNDSCPQKSDTIKNLGKIGFPNVDSSNVFLKNEKKGWSSEKKSRRAIVSQKYRIVMFVGDDLGDFLPNVKRNIIPVERAFMVTEHSEK